MKKGRTAVFAIALLLCGAGCGKTDENVVKEPQWEAVDDGESSGNAEDEKGSKAADNQEWTSEKEGVMPPVEGLIESQSFEVELDGWGKVFFASTAPANEGEGPHFALIREEETVYTFPETEKSTGNKFEEVSAVAFQDYNQDGKKDVVVLITYGDGENRWNEPAVFLQENSDNMFYLDYPEMESYRVDKKTESGPWFYRDTFLEEYLSRQRLTDTISGLLGSYAEYMDYVDSLSGSFSAERQIKLFADNRKIWMEGMDYANDVHRFTIAGLGYDGRLTLIVSNQGGTGRYTYSEFYQINEKGELKRLETSFKEGDSQPDIMEESMTVYSSFSVEGMRNYFIVYDELKDSADSYVYRVSSLSLSDDYVLETPLASQRVVYEGENYAPWVTGYDCGGNPLTEDEYENFADTYYNNMGFTKKAASFKWIDVGSLDGRSDKEAEEALRQAYGGFALN